MKFLVVLGVFALAAGSSAQSCSGGYKKNPSDCNAYYQCSNGQWALMRCQAGLNWNAAGNYCDWPASAGCTAGAPAPAPAPAPGPAPAPAPAPSGSGSGLISQAEFQCAAKTKGGNPDASYYAGFTNSLSKAGITTKTEAAKFLAHAVWETVGFQYTKEVYCQTNDCSVAYPNQQGGLPGKVYYGRGMLQLTWDYNYKSCSQYLYNDDRLIQNPDQVATDPAIGWATAACFWVKNVHANSATFGQTLKAINGALECDGGSHGENRVLRFNHYKTVLACLNIAAPSDSDGACSAW